MDSNQVETLLKVTEAMAAELSDYLLGDKLYRQLIVQTPTGTQQPKMTLGALLENVETLRWLEGDLSPDQQRRVEAVAKQIDLDREVFFRQWRSFLQREVKAVMGSWKWYLDDAAQDPQARENYRSEVYHRTRLDLLMRELASDPAVTEDRRELGQLDQRLRGMLRAGGYAGPGGQEKRFSPQQAWWLFGRLKGED